MGKRIVSPKTSNLMKVLIQLNVTEGTKKICRSSRIKNLIGMKFYEKKVSKNEIIK